MTNLDDIRFPASVIAMIATKALPQGLEIGATTSIEECSIFDAVDREFYEIEIHDALPILIGPKLTREEMLPRIAKAAKERRNYLTMPMAEWYDLTTTAIDAALGDDAAIEHADLLRHLKRLTTQYFGPH